VAKDEVLGPAVSG